MFKYNRLSLITSLMIGFVGLNTQAAKYKDPGVSDAEVVIGNHSVQTGPNAFYGLIYRTAAKYIEAINEKGGVDGRQVKLLIEDNGHTTQKAIAGARKLVEKEKVFAFFGGQGFMHSSVLPYLQKKKVPDLWISDATPSYFSPLNKYTFGSIPTFAQEGQQMGEWMAKKWPGKKIGVIYPNTSGGKDALESIKKAVSGKMNVVGQEIVEWDATTANAQILNLKNLGAEVLYLVTVPPLTPSIMKFVKEKSLDMKLMLIYYNSVQVTLDMAGKEASEGVYSSQFVKNENDVNDKGIAAHIKFLADKMPGEKASWLTLYGQAQAELLLETIHRAKDDMSREGLLKAAETFKDWRCSVCIVDYNTSSTNHLPIQELKMVEAKNGRWNLIEEQDLRKK